ncbi:BTAD domain-containing putative transcriptional regulator [Micromonospora endolithica]|uniref:LysM peptidoglycan-binding domain-containing protein n=1 Tax=Micromonospora endolithica TaxID=230091 RepID=A0A3A9ZCS1_9ACTN|nr:BTAD domain-containing putative transcriptional regulator [Micromonospora endolithica]RKN46158.1 LysM peptidoglycan-binding domain-containing protein [Micromonospora endolithica]TWJ25137.1 DNA-binding SARP family transcriptional activator [Micromonospora endolithica]
MRTTSGVRSITATLTSGLVLAAVPAALVRYLGLPEVAVPSASAVRVFVREPLTEDFILVLVQAGAWGIWALLATTTGLRGYQRLTRALRWLPALHLPGPLQHLTAVMLGATAVSAATGALPAHASQPGPTATTGDAIPREAARSVDRSTLIGSQPATDTTAPRATHTVARGDTLSAIAQRRLGDDDRWPEIFALNRGTRFPDVGGTLRDPDVIRPGWTLDLPADAAAAPQRQTRTTPPEPPATAIPTPASPMPSPPTTATPSAGPTASATAHTPTCGASTGQAPARTAAPTTATDGSDTTSAAPDRDTRGRSGNGVLLPSGSWIDIGLALAIVAAAALVWAHRQRRYVPRKPSTSPRTHDTDLAALPRVVTQIRRGLRCATTKPDTTDQQDGTPSDPDGGTDTADDPAEIDAPSMVSADEQVQNAGSPVPVAPSLAHPLSVVWQPAGLGLTGPGAPAAARGLLTAVLAAGDGDRPDGRTVVVMPAATAATLLGSAAALPRTPRLLLAADLDDALRVIDEQTMHRSRLVHQHDVDTVADLRAADPCEEPLPPVMLLAHDTGRHARSRVAALLAQGQRLDIHGVLLGAWPEGDTVDVAHDGTVTPADGDARCGGHPAEVGRLAVLSPAETIDILATLAESHTGQPPTPAAIEAAPSALTAPADTGSADTSAASPSAPSPSADDATANTSFDPVDAGRYRAAARNLDEATDTARGGAGTATDDISAADQPILRTSTAAADGGDTAPADTIPTVPVPPTESTGKPRPDTQPLPVARPDRVMVTVLGAPTIVGADPQRKPRAKSLELLVYLAVHDGAATAEAILDDLLPDAPVSKATHRLHTYISDLRAVLRHQAGPGTYLTRPHHQYQLHGDRFDIDLWRMREAIRVADTAGTRAERIEALRRAAAYRPLAEGCDYEWLEPHRHAVQREALDAVAALVEELTDQPAEQAAVCETALQHHPYAETLYQQAMRAHARLGHLDTIRALRRTLTRRLTEIDTEPSEDTLALADRLITDLRRPRQNPRSPQPFGDGAPA